MTKPKILPVIHYLNKDLALEEADKAYNSGADGIFLISHHNNDMELISIGCAIKNKYKNFPVGVNFLSMSGDEAFFMAQKFSFHMVWG